MSTWRETKHQLKAAHAEDVIARIKSDLSAGRTIHTVAKGLGWSTRGLCRWLDRHDRHDLAARLWAQTGPMPDGWKP